MPAMGAAHGRNSGGMAGRFEPIMDRRTDRAAPDGRFAGAIVPRNQEDDSLAARDRLIQGTVNGTPGAVEAHPMKVDDTVGRD
jgi:hypothetical protein